MMHIFLFAAFDLVIEKESAKMFYLGELFLLTPVEIFRKQSFLVVKAPLHLFKLVFTHIKVKAKATES